MACGWKAVLLSGCVGAVFFSVNQIGDVGVCFLQLFPNLEVNLVLNGGQVSTYDVLCTDSPVCVIQNHTL